ncbi:MAG: hypothetical protein ACOCZ8_03345 [Bacteroidota bacterium]
MTEDGKKLSGAEERERLKQVYLKELRLRKQFLQKMRSGRQLGRIANELEKMVSMQHDDTDEWIRKLEEGTAIDEAKLEIALEKMRMTDLNDISGTAELGETPTESQQEPAAEPKSKAEQAQDALAKFMMEEGLDDDLPEHKKTLGGGLEEATDTKKTLGINLEETEAESPENQEATPNAGSDTAATDADAADTEQDTQSYPESEQ